MNRERAIISPDNAPEDMPHEFDVCQIQSSGQRLQFALVVVLRRRSQVDIGQALHGVQKIISPFSAESRPKYRIGASGSALRHDLRGQFWKCGSHFDSACIHRSQSAFLSRIRWAREIGQRTSHKFAASCGNRLPRPEGRARRPRYSIPPYHMPKLSAVATLTRLAVPPGCSWDRSA